MESMFDCIVFFHLSCTNEKNSFTLGLIFQIKDLVQNLFLYSFVNSEKFIFKIWSLVKRFIKFFLVFERHSKIQSNSGKILYWSCEILVTSSDFLFLNSANIRKMCLREHISFPKDLRTKPIQTLSLSYGFAKHSNFHF